MSNKSESLMELLREVNREIHRQIRDIVMQYDVSFTNMMVIRHIKAEPGITISGMSRRTHIAKSHISNLVKELTQRGWIETRTDSSDLRVLRLYLTSAATENLETIGKEIRGKIDSLLAGIPEARTAEIIESLRDVQTALKQAGKKERDHDSSNEIFKTV